MQASIVEGHLITKELRHTLFGTIAGGSGSTKPEEYQRHTLSTAIGYNCNKTNMRINLRDNTLNDIAKPNKNDNGFDYSEDFDGIIEMKDATVYTNFKCIVGAGGSQTRSLREVYWFVEGQLRILLNKTDDKSIYFANILDGDEAHSTFSKFQYLLSLPDFETVKNKVYVGDLKGSIDWFKETFPQ